MNFSSFYCGGSEWKKWNALRESYKCQAEDGSIGIGGKSEQDLTSEEKLFQTAIITISEATMRMWPRQYFRSRGNHNTPKKEGEAIEETIDIF